MLAVAAVLAQQVPTWSELGQLGVVALALIVGAVGTAWAMNKFVVQPERKGREQERLDRIAAQAETKEAYQVTTPALAQANQNHAAMLALLTREGRT